MSAAQLKELAEFQRGIIPTGWLRLVCRGCGADYCTSDGPLLFEPCGNCGTPVGYVTKATVRYGR